MVYLALLFVILFEYSSPTYMWARSEILNPKSMMQWTPAWAPAKRLTCIIKALNT